MRRSLIFLLFTIAVAVVTLDAARRQAPAVVTANADAVRLNNLGVASMNQQKFEAALKYFQDASARDASFPLAKVNEAIADLALQRYEPAQALLEAAVKTDDKNARAWYNLGLLQKGLGNADASLAAFARAAELAPADAHARYFVGLIASQSQKYDDAIAAFTKALETDPFLVSAEFGLARAYQRSGKPDDAKTHMDRFTRMTQSKVASAMSLAYGDQGPLSLAAAAQLPAAALTTIPVTFVVDSKLPIGDRAGVLGDFDNDEHDDLATVSAQGVRVFHDDGHGNFVDVTEKVGLPATIEGAVGVTFVDVDHDGDLDLIVTGSHTRLFRNNGNSTFTDVTVERGFDIPNTVGVLASDLNNDRAIDLVLTGEKTTILLNPREGAFKKLDAFGATVPTATRGVVAFDFDKDGWMDLALTSGAAPALTVWRNVKGQSFERVDLPASTITEGFGLTAVDYDNDGWLDLVAAGAGPKGGALQAWRNVQGRFTEDSSRLGLAAVSLKQPREVFAGDLDGDNDADLIVTDAVATPVRLRNDGGNASHAIRLALTGLNDNRSGIGTKVEVQAGAIWQKFETTAASSLLGSHAGEILAGVGQATEVDVVRLLWPTGVVQDEVQLAANAPHKIQQIDRRGSSCPILFSWNGSRFEFISDTIGPAVIGHWVAPGEYDTPDTDEFVKVDGSKVRVKNGVLSFHFTEPMEEINYLDQVKLFVVDHPEGTEANPNEYFAAEPPFPADRTLVSRGARLPRGAWDDKGHDLLPALREVDRKYADTFQDAPFKGFATLHALELDLGDVDTRGPLHLLMRGFTDYFTATSMYAADQANVKVIVPYLEAQLAGGSWKRVSDDIGFPAGLHRTMTADLTGKLPAGTRRIRIWTNLKIYWDQVLVDTTPEASIPFTRTEIPLVRASLAFRGYPREILGTPTADIRYDFNDVSLTGPYARHRGFYTKYGDVTPLLRDAEDHFVIFGSGDDVAIDFDAAKLPPLRPGWTRDYEIYLDGFVKDMDFWGAFAQTVTPLPFKAMPSYPYPATVAYPARNQVYQLDWNTREVSGEGHGAYRFEYRRNRK
jgi:Tfp pilus assembly protein PilF